MRPSSVRLLVITLVITQNILDLYFGRSKVIFWLIIGDLIIVTVAFHFKMKTFLAKQNRLACQTLYFFSQISILSGMVDL